MTRTAVVASSRSRKRGATPMRKGLSSRWPTLLALPVALVIAAVLLAPAGALAAEPTTTGYNQTPPPPKTTPTTPTTPATPTGTSGTSPSKEEKTPSSEKTTPTTPTSETAPATSTTPTATTSTTAKATTLPFTGFDLRWVVVIGVLLIAAGASLLTLQRRQRNQGS